MIVAPSWIFWGILLLLAVIVTAMAIRWQIEDNRNALNDAHRRDIDMLAEIERRRRFDQLRAGDELARRRRSRG